MGTEDPSAAGESTGGGVPAGWYPVQGGNQRYWDGTAWTDHVAPAPGSPPGPKPPGPAAQPGSGFPPGVGDAGPAWNNPQGQVPFGQPPVPFGVADPTAVTADDRTMATVLHVLGLFTGFIGPLILWLVKKDESLFVDAHGKTALNFHLSMFIYWMVAVITIFFLIGFLLLPVLLLLNIIFPIMAAVAANRGERYTYPLSIPFFS